MSVERFFGPDEPWPNVSGDMVRYTDYEALERVRQELANTITDLRESHLVQTRLAISEAKRATALAEEVERMRAALKPMRTGDVVYHVPSREEWVVAWADHNHGYMAPCGWPECQAKITDCVVIKRASDEEAEKLVSDIEKSGRRDARRARALLTQADGGAE